MLRRLAGPSATLAALCLLGLVSTSRADNHRPAGDANCKLGLAGTVSDTVGLPLLKGVESTHAALLELIGGAQKSLKIAAFHLELTPVDHRPNQQVALGMKVRAAIKQAAGRGVRVQLVLDHSNRRFLSNMDDVAFMGEAVEVRFLNLKRPLSYRSLQASFVLADDAAFYLGSADLDWRAYSRTNELGVTARSCPALASDLAKVFHAYTLMFEAGKSSVDQRVLDALRTKINQAAPLVADGLKVYIAASPSDLNDGPVGAADRRTDDIEALLHTIDSAKERIDVSVMDYNPRLVHNGVTHYWSPIGDALREAAGRNVRVRLMFAVWPKMKPADLMWYKSLARVPGIHVKMFEVPTNGEWIKTLPHDRLKHEKYMVTDAGLYLGTNNWWANLFEQACGLSLVLEPTEGGPQHGGLIQTARDIFERDFNSEHSLELDALL